MNDITQQLKDLLGDRLKENESMAKHTNFKIGGPARWYTEVKTEEELLAAINTAEQAEVPFVIHGGGSNILYADAGYDGLVIVPALREVKIDGNTVTAEAGALSALVARKTAEAGLAGLTWMISLPGTIGGAVRGNAGCFGGETRDKLKFARIGKMENGKLNVNELTADDLEMSYRHSKLKVEPGIVIEAVFELEAGDPAALKTELEKNLEARKTSQPTNVGSAGCIFKNYDVASDEEMAKLEAKLEIPEAMKKTRRLSAGWIIDQLDLKGKQIGGAKISEEHGNFLINDGTATADHIMQLIALVKSRARDELGIQLHEEVQYVG